MTAQPHTQSGPCQYGKLTRAMVVTLWVVLSGSSGAAWYLVTARLADIHAVSSTAATEARENRERIAQSQQLPVRLEERLLAIDSRLTRIETAVIGAGTNHP